MSATLLGAISVGQVIDGKFPLLRELGGTEWTSAWTTELEDDHTQKAAVKIFPFESVDSRATISRWNVARTLSHPHLMPLLDAGRCEVDGEGLLYVVTEYADETLSQLLPERPLSIQEAQDMLGPILDALSYLHNLGLTHGHLRPTNVMVINDQLKLSPDFGWCARRLSIYDPPEAGAGNASPAADIWSLGILLVEALTQRPPLWNRSRDGDPEIPAAIPEPFFTICRECLRIDPQRRCTLDDIKARLCPPQSAEPAVQHAAPASAGATAAPSAKPLYGFRAMFLAGSILFLLLMIAAFRFGWSLTPSSPWPPLRHPLMERVASPAPTAATAPALSPAPAAKAPAAAPSKTVLPGWVAQRVLPEIPGKILSSVQGHINVIIRVEVDAKGTISLATIQSPGPSIYFANQALQAAQNWTFIPAQVDGRATASTWLLQFEFSQSNIVVTPTEKFP